jgi:hypothetical protein
VLLPAAPLAAQPLGPDDFARGLRLEAAADAPLHALVLPRAVYQTATRDDLGDLRVFNAGGEELPHAIARHDAAEPAAPAGRDLPFFPVRGQPGADLSDLTVQVSRTASGALVQVDERAAPRAAGRPVRAYLIDAAGLDAPVRSLTFAWADTASFITDVVAETSDDLTTWAPWGGPATLAQLRYGGNTLRRDEMALPPRRARYVRLSWPGGEAPPPLARLVAVPAAGGEPERQWARVTGTAVPEPGVYRFDQEGRLPVDRVRFELPQANTLARVELASSADPEGPWTPRYRGLLYRLRVGGRDLSMPPQPVDRTPDRYWRLTVDQAGGGLGQGAPALELGWTPERLLFVARGAPPYTLAFGRAGADPAGFEPDELLRLLPDGPAAGSGLPPAAVAGDAFELGGAARLVPSRDVPWSRILLWATLVLGVAVLAFMSVRLLRQIDRDRQTVAGGEGG